MSDLRVPIAAALAAFGLTATVTRPDDETAISTTGFWLSPLHDDQPVGVSFTRRQPRRVFVVPRSSVPSAPKGSTVLAAEYAGGPVLSWQVDEYADDVEPDHLRLIVKRSAE